MVEKSLEEIILAAFLAGAKAGVIDAAVPIVKETGKRVGKQAVKRVTGTRGKLRKPSTYITKYGVNFKKIAPKNKKKDGSWKKDGFKRTQKAAHAATKKEMKK